MTTPVLAANDVDGPEALDYYYRNFFQTEVPAGTSATQAWVGTVRPLDADAGAKLVLRCLDRDLQVEVDQGTLRAPAGSTYFEPHPLESFLVNARIGFSLLVLDFDGERHPQVFSLAPYIDPILYPAHPHLRLDQVIPYRGRNLPALCVYSAAEFRYPGAAPRLAEFLDQTATYLAKHVIWLRTRRLYHAGSGKLLYAPKPGEAIVDSEPRDVCFVRGVHCKSRESGRVWSGYWPGTSAPMGPASHVRCIARQAPCWCGSGNPYDSCHRAQELGWLRQRNS